MLYISEQTYAPGLKQARHAHADMTVTLVLRGSLQERVGSHQEIARPLSVVIKPTDIEHANEFGPSGARTLQIRVGSAESATLAEWQASLGHWRWLHAPAAIGSFLSLLEAHHKCAGNQEALQSYAIDALAALAPDAAPMNTRPSWLASIREAIDDATHPPRLADLARAADVHPVYLARQFRRAFGCSMSEYIQRRRIQRVAELTCDNAKSLSTAAHAAGFSDHAHMCRVFRDQIRVAPHQVRKLLTA
jgi:AraC family transcriptional regulator